MSKKDHTLKPVSLNQLPKHIQERLAMEHSQIKKDFLKEKPCNLIFLLGPSGKIPSLS